LKSTAWAELVRKATDERKITTFSKQVNKINKLRATSDKDIPGGRVVNVLAIGTKLLGLKPGRQRWTFKDDKYSQHTFLKTASKTGGPMSNDFTVC
jgi:hypothetical protein